MKRFPNFETAFDYCREGNKPVTVIVEGEFEDDDGPIWTLFPSGYARKATAAERRLTIRAEPEGESHES